MVQKKFKAILRSPTGNDARKFWIDQEVATNYMYLKEKLKTIFPNLKNANFKITWLDKDNDEITITTDEDLEIALIESNSTEQALYLTIIHPNDPPSTCPWSDAPSTAVVICDICDIPISGLRHKCVQCPDYDLCSSCAYQGHHRDHLMIRIPPGECFMPKNSRKFVHQIARHLKRAAYAAGKEAHHAAKAATKLGTSKPAESGDNAPAGAAAGPSNQTDETNTNQGCPFNMNDVLNSMANDHLGPLLNILQQPGTTQEQQHQTGENLFNFLRNTLDGFFANAQQANNNNPSGEAEPSQAPNIPDIGNQTPASNSQPMNVPDLSHSVPMDVETGGATHEKPQVVGENSGKINGEQTSPPSQIPVEPTAPYFVNTADPFSLRLHEALRKLHEMGFTDYERLVQLLKAHDADVGTVVRILLLEDK